MLIDIVVTVQACGQHGAAGGSDFGGGSEEGARGEEDMISGGGDGQLGASVSER
jgi:hypothetical protein